MDTNWLKLRQEQITRSRWVSQQTPMKIRQVNRYWRDQGVDSMEAVFEGGIKFTSAPYHRGHIPDARDVYDELIADRQIKHEKHNIDLYVCKNPEIDDVRVNVLEIQQQAMVQCWVWLAEHWGSGCEDIRVWELTHMHIGNRVTQYRLNETPKRKQL